MVVLNTPFVGVYQEDILNGGQGLVGRQLFCGWREDFDDQDG